jgi:hypothetical protein
MGDLGRHGSPYLGLAINGPLLVLNSVVLLVMLIEHSGGIH